MELGNRFQIPAVIIDIQYEGVSAAKIPLTFSGHPFLSAITPQSGGMHTIAGM